MTEETKLFTNRQTIEMVFQKPTENVQSSEMAVNYGQFLLSDDKET